MNVVARKLVFKELYVYRWFMVATAVAAALSMVAAAFGKAGFNIGALSWLTTIIAYGVMLAIYGIAQERKENSLHFVMSLPVSPAEYVRAKLLGMLLCFLLPWLCASAAAVALIFLAPGIPDGLAPYAILLCVYLFTNFTIVMCGTLHARTDAIVAGIIILTNMSVSLFLFAVSSAEDIKSHMGDASPTWNNAFFSILLVEITVLVIAATLPLATAARRRDFL
ncbi:MAG TPA: ABC transporter permease [Steroidobacteraceae bacterium]